MNERQQILHLWLAAASLDTEVKGWAFHDGTDGAGPPLPTTQPPYPTGIDAMRDGWCCLQTPGPESVDTPRAELHAEFVFERRFHTT